LGVTYILRLALNASLQPVLVRGPHYVVLEYHVAQLRVPNGQFQLTHSFCASESLVDEFYTTLQNYAGIELSDDGPLLLWLTLTHFHPAPYPTWLVSKQTLGSCLLLHMTTMTSAHISFGCSTKLIRCITHLLEA